MKLIDKDKVVEEINVHLEFANNGILYAQAGIEQGLKKYENDLNAWQHCQSMCKNILAFLNTLEVKEVIAEQECICNEALNRIIGGSWNLLCPVNKLGLKTGDKVKVIIKGTERRII